jgi:hypothetical protein
MRCHRKLVVPKLSGFEESDWYQYCAISDCQSAKDGLLVVHTAGEYDMYCKRRSYMPEAWGRLGSSSVSSCIMWGLGFRHELGALICL